MSIRSELRSAIASSGESVSHVAREAGIPQQVLQRFVSGERDNLRLDTLEKLLGYLEIKLLKSAEVAVPADHQILVGQRRNAILRRLRDVKDYVVVLRLSPSKYKELWTKLEAVEQATDELVKSTIL